MNTISRDSLDKNYAIRAFYPPPEILQNYGQLCNGRICPIPKLKADLPKINGRYVEMLKPHDVFQISNLRGRMLEKNSHLPSNPLQLELKLSEGKIQ